MSDYLKFLVICAGLGIPLFMFAYGVVVKYWWLVPFALFIFANEFYFFLIKGVLG